MVDKKLKASFVREPRHKMIMVRVTESELHHIKVHSKKTGIAMSDYVRSAALSKVMEEQEKEQHGEDR